MMNRKPLHIGILARGLSEPVGGVKQYIRDVADALIRVDARNRYSVFYDSPQFKKGYPNAEEIVISAPHKLLWDHWLFPRFLRRHPLDVLFCPKCVVPCGVSIPSVVTIHDMLYFPIPGKITLNEYKPLDVLYMRTLIPRSIRRSAHIVADSVNTMDDIVRLFPEAASKTSVVHLGVSTFASNPTDPTGDPSALEAMKITQPYIFYSGTTSPRKNIRVLIRAMGMIQNRIPHRLIITGGGNEKSTPLSEELQRLGLTDRVRILGAVSLSNLTTLYRNAGVFVFPSLYEGFGLPVLEAMALGCPVISSNTSSLPEVAGDAAILFNPTDEKELADCLLRVLENPEVRRGLTDRGSRWVKEFTWEKTAKAMIDVFENLP